jgi:hypothetical protein
MGVVIAGAVIFLYLLLRAEARADAEEDAKTGRAPLPPRRPR